MESINSSRRSRSDSKRRRGFLFLLLGSISIVGGETRLRGDVKFKNLYFGIWLVSLEFYGAEFGDFIATDRRMREQ
jgi:hypothetical protein